VVFRKPPSRTAASKIFACYLFMSSPGRQDDFRRGIHERFEWVAGYLLEDVKCVF
jgi:hypothetical protein